MDIEELILKTKRNYDIEKEAINDMARILRPYITKKEITKVLEENGFAGFYIIKEELFNDHFKEDTESGLYDTIYKAAIMNEKQAAIDPTIKLHELFHACLDAKNIKKILSDGVETNFGVGFEEGAASIIHSINNYKDIDKAKPTCYVFQSRLFQQLNVLYNYTKIKEYPNLLISMMKKPEQFLPLIRDIYSDLLEDKIECTDKLLFGKSAHHMVCIADILTEKKYLDRRLYDFANFLNSLYLTIADFEIYRGKKTNKLFSIPDVYLAKPGLDFLLQLFDIDKYYCGYRLEYLKSLLCQMETEICLAVDSSPEDKNIKCMKR